MTVEALIAKAEQAAASARILLEAGDADGACNRAYFAMFDAARAALLASGHALGKTHRGVLSAFSKHLIKEGVLPPELGRMLKLAETRRYVADYEGDSVRLSDARTMIEEASEFIAAIRTASPPSG